MKYSSRILPVVLALSATLSSVDAFTSLSSRSSHGAGLQQVNSRFMGKVTTFKSRDQNVQRQNHRKGTELGMFLGSDGGILGVGAPEVATILLVGYFVLGPTELFKLTKEIGKFIQNFRTLGTEATKSFESTMENQLELQELRKAQSELNNAFNFRRSINVDAESEAFSEIPPISQEEETAVGAVAATATATVDAPKKKKKRRRVKKKAPVEEPMMGTGEIPDLDMSTAFEDEFKKGMGVDSTSAPTAPIEETEAEMKARIRKERMERLEAAQARSEAREAEEAQAAAAAANDGYDWATASESDIASEVLAQQQSPDEAAAAQSRFQAQMSGQWNDQVMANEESLSPLAIVMQKIAVLEEEKIATNMRLDEEFARRMELEEKFYEEKRALLEQAAAEISAEAYSNFSFEEETSEEEKEEPKAEDETEETKNESPEEKEPEDAEKADEIKLKDEVADDKKDEPETTTETKTLLGQNLNKKEEAVVTGDQTKA